MSFLRRGKSRRAKSSRALVTVFALVGFQALAIVGAGVANAVAACTYNPATDTINITLPVAGDSAFVAVETAADDLDADSPAGAILFAPSGAFPPDYEQGALSSACGSATNSNTVAIIVLGSPNGDEFFGIDEVSGATFSTTIAWAIDMGGNPVGTLDEFEIEGNDDVDDNMVVTNTSFTLNGGGGELNGVEDIQLFGNDGDDTLDGSALTTTVEFLAEGGPGDDWVAPGAHLTGDFATGGTGVDTLSYGTRTTPTVIDNVLGVAGHDANSSGTLVAPEEIDVHSAFEVLETGSGNDTLIGAAGVDETFVPGDGDDDITGNGGDDLLDYTSSSAGVTIDPDAGTVTGQGTDDFTGILHFMGSPLDDILIWDSSVDGFAGGDGTDTVDASTSTTGQSIDLDDLDDLSGTNAEDVDTDTTENAIGGSGPDTLDGNDIRNKLEGGAGDDDLDGEEGNDLLLGGPGNDDFTGGEGADRVSFIGSPQGVNVDLSLGFATGEGDDSFGDGIEIIVGSQFNDHITGGPFATGGTVNFLFVGRRGNDVLTGFNGNDNLKGGGGNDILRGVGGDDILRGANGNDRLFGGSGTDVGNGGKGQDSCRGVEIRRSCGTPRNPRAPQAARLV
jgi:Ca2+-binding RTX toxin-like protein